jgi:LemA protein
MKRWFLMVVAVLALSGCGYNDFQRLDEQTKAAWSEVLNQYQRRADLVPNIVATVKGEAAFRAGHTDQGGGGAPRRSRSRPRR